MFEIVLGVVLLTSALIGLTHLLICLRLLLLRPAARHKQILTVMLDGDDAELQLRAAIEQTRAALCVPVHIIAVDQGLPKELAQVCNKLVREHANVLLCTPSELEEAIAFVTGK